MYISPLAHDALLPLVVALLPCLQLAALHPLLRKVQQQVDPLLVVAVMHLRCEWACSAPACERPERETASLPCYSMRTWWGTTLLISNTLPGATGISTRLPSESAWNKKCTCR